jgi:RNA polymerase sigma-70 factor (ECF subfamily)
VTPDASATRDAELPGWLARARTGELAAFAPLVRAHQSRVRLQLRRLTRGDESLADDLAQETFVQAWLHLGEFRGDARLSTWLHRIALRCWLQHARRPQPPLEWRDAPDDESWRAAPYRDPRPAEDLRLDIEQALRGLTEIQRLAVVHCFHLDLSHEEAAEVLGLPLGTLKSHLARAKTRLRATLEAWKEEPAS